MTAVQSQPSRPTTAPGRRAAPRRAWLDRRYLPVVGTLVVLVLIFVVGGIRYENFVSGRVISNLLLNNAHLVALAVGMTFVILTGGIDLSVGAVVALSGIVAAVAFQAGLPVAVVVPLVVLVGTAIGLVVGVMVQVFGVQPFVASLAAMFLARGLCYVLAPESVPIRDEGFVAFSNVQLEVGDGWRVTGAGLIALATVAAGFWVLHYTRFGRTAYAIGGSEQSATLMGLPVARTRVLVYVVSGTCAGIGGLLFTMYSRSGYSLTGVGMELDAIAAVVIGGTLLTGGTGYVVGSLLGVLVLGLIQTIITVEGTLNSWWTRIVIGVLVLVFVVLQRVLGGKRAT